MSQRLALLSIVLYLATGSASVAEGRHEACDSAQLPEGVRATLESHFAQWRYETTSDLNDYYRDGWMKSSPTKCPGMVVGHINDAKVLSYAFLLLPRQGKAEKFKLIVIKRAEKGGYVVDEVASYESQYHYSVISKAGPKQYKDQEKDTRITLVLDGIIVEELGAGASLYYWRGGKYKEILISE